MAKYGNIFFMEVSRHIFDEKYREMSDQARVLFFFLNELEQRFTSGKRDADGITERGLGKDCFFRSDEDLARDLAWSVSKVKRAKKELVSVPELVRITQIHFNNGDITSNKHITCYKLIKEEARSVRNKPVNKNIGGWE